MAVACPLLHLFGHADWQVSLAAAVPTRPRLAPPCLHSLAAPCMPQQAARARPSPPPISLPSRMGRWQQTHHAGAKAERAVRRASRCAPPQVCLLLEGSPAALLAALPGHVPGRGHHGVCHHHQRVSHVGAVSKNSFSEKLAARLPCRCRCSPAPAQPAAEGTLFPATCCVCWPVSAAASVRHASVLSKGSCLAWLPLRRGQDACRHAVSECAAATATTLPPADS